MILLGMADIMSTTLIFSFSRACMVAPKLAPKVTPRQILCAVVTTRHSYKRNSELGLTTATTLVTREDETCGRPQKMKLLKKLVCTWPRASPIQLQEGLSGFFMSTLLESFLSHTSLEVEADSGFIWSYTGSVSYGVDPTLCSLSYKTVDDAVRVNLHEGRGNSAVAR